MADTDDDISDILDTAMNRPEDEIPDIFEDERVGGDGGSDGGSVSASGDTGGGDIDDDPEPTGNRLNLDQLRAEKISQAQKLYQDWETEHQRQARAFEDAQNAYQKARLAVVDDGADPKIEFDALNALMEARGRFDKATDGYGQAQAWLSKVQNEPEATPAQKAWLESNPRYMSDERYQAQVNKHMAKLRSEGYDDTRAPFYERLNQRLREQPRMGQDRRPASGAPVIRTSKTDQARQENGKIKPGEERFIQRLGFNPNDKRVREQYLASRANTLRIARQRGQI